MLYCFKANPGNSLAVQWLQLPLQRSTGLIPGWGTKIPRAMAGSSVLGILQARILGVGCHPLLQGIFLTQEPNLCLLHRRQILYCLSHQGSHMPCSEAKKQSKMKKCKSQLMYFSLSAAAAWSLQLCLILLCPWDSPGKKTGVGCYALLQGIFSTQGLNSGLLHWQVDSLPLSH